MDAVLVFDDSCRLCLNLAELVAKRASPQITIERWSVFRLSPTASSYFSDNEVPLQPPSIFVVTTNPQAVRSDGEAWQYLLDYYGDLQPLRWLARQLGFEPAAATLLQRAAYRFKRMCSRC